MLAALVAGPEEGVGGEAGGGEEVGVDVADAFAEEVLLFDEFNTAAWVAMRAPKRLLRSLRSIRLLTMVPHDDFAKHIGMAKDLTIVEELAERRVFFSSVIDPD